MMPFFRRSVRILIFFVVFSSMANQSTAGDVNPERARNAAANWLQAVQGLFGSRILPRNIAAEEPIFYNGRLVGYNYILSPAGHIVVPVRDELPPVKIYSMDSTLSFNEDSEPVRWISEELYKLSLALDEHAEEFQGINMKFTRNGRLWESFGRDTTSFRQVFDYASTPGGESLSLGALLQTQWDQSVPYNLLSPDWYNGDPTLTGCVATAAAQIMKYWNYPAAGRGAVSYIWYNGSADQTLSRDFNSTTYDWASMTNTYSPGSTTVQRNAVAQIMADAGYAFQMDFGPDSIGGSVANTLYGATVFPEFFKYKNTIQTVFREDYTSDSAWMQVFKNELQNGRVSQLRIRGPEVGGHSVVVDGYRDSPSESIHLNMGWSGSYDAWYVTNNIVTGTLNWTDVNYQAAVIGIEPGTLSPGSIYFGPVGGAGSITLETCSSCNWSSSEALSWVAINSGNGGTGNGSVHYTVAANTGVNARTGKITVAGMSFPVIQAGSSGIADLLQNPGFESGRVPWFENWPGYLIGNWQPRSGSRHAWLGGWDNGYDEIYQDIYIPDEATDAYVRFWYWIKTDETAGTPKDIMTVEIRSAGNNLLGTLATLSNLTSKSGYVQSPEYSVIDYKGQTVRLAFKVLTDGAYLTHFLIDEVMLRSTSSCSNPKIKISSESHSTLQSAFTAASPDSLIRSRALIFTENPEFNKTGIEATLEGGYNCDYSDNPEHTVLIGSLTIKNGKLTVSKISIQ